MIISPPFLLDRQADEADAAYVARCMPDTSVCVRDTNAPEGSFAVSFLLGWHGGLHLQAPINGQTRQNVRAIADGEIVYARRPTRPNETPSPAESRNYNPYPDSDNNRCWTDDGCVVIRHRTQIGADAQGRPVEVTFFSIYEHLSTLRGPALQAANGAASCRVWRKDEIGTAGRVYGREHQLHFEIACDDANLERLIGRRTGNLNTGADGRCDVVFGELYFRLPAGTQVFAVRPLDNDPVAHHRPPNHPADQPAVPLAPSHTTPEVLIVGLSYAVGDGAANQRGHAYLATYREDGTPLGDPLPEPNAEYNLCARATEISRAYPEGRRPAPSAVYELLRFGRIVDTAHETLTPANVPHWRQIRHAGGQGWVNLNADGLRKYSDADFPHWEGWTLIDDDTDADSRCESAMITRLIENPEAADGQLARDELLQRLPLPEVRERLKRTLCKFPTEFNQTTIDERWGWLRNDPELGLGEHYDEFAAHVRALTIPWDENWLPNAHWHLQPREFITIWRKCGWLSENEFKQLLPSHAVRTGTFRNAAGQNQTGTFWERVPPNLDNDDAPILVHRIPLNKTFRKYGFVSPMRMASFFGNATQETSWFSTLAEGGGSTRWYAPWFGRGFLQLTHAENYISYWRWRGRTIPEALKTALDTAGRTAHDTGNNTALQDANFPALTQEMREWREQVGGNERPNPAEGRFAPADSAGHYAITSHGARTLVQYADGEHRLQRWPVGTVDSRGRPQGTQVYYRSLTFWQVSASVNLPGAANRTTYMGLNGFDSRCSAYGVALAVLTEMKFPDAQGGITLEYPEGYTPMSRRRNQ